MKRIVVLLAALLVAGAAFAQQYPNRAVRMVIPWPPGQATDLVGRVMAEKLSQVFGQPVVPDNRPGAGGMIGTDFAAKAAPDGYTLLAASSGPVTINPLLQKTAYDPERDLIPVVKVGVSPYVLVTNPAFPAANISEFLALVRANPGKYSFASSGTGATAHLISEWFNILAGIKATHVPYKGSAPALTDVVGGQVSYMIETVAATMPLVRSGRLKAFGVSLEKGTALTPGIEPLAVSAKLPGFDAGAWARAHGARRHAQARRRSPRCGDGDLDAGRRHARATVQRRPRGGLPARGGVRAGPQGATRTLRRHHPEGKHQARLESRRLR